MGSRDYCIRPSLCYSWIVIRGTAMAARSAGSLSRLDYSHQAAAALQLDVVVGCVVGYVTVDEPLTCLSRLPEDVIALARSNIDSIRIVTRRRLECRPRSAHDHLHERVSEDLESAH